MRSKYKTGLERFYQRYPQYPIQEIEGEYLGIGAMVIPIGRHSLKAIDLNNT